MKPPARKSRPVDSRMLVTRAVTMRPSTSKRIASPTLNLRTRSRRLSSIDTSGSPAGGPSSHHAPSIELLVGLEVGPIGDGELARQAAAAAHVLVALEVDVASAHADDARAQHRNQLRRGVVAVLRDRGARSRRRAAPAGCRAGTCPARPRPSAARSRWSRFACSARTPRMKKVPRPTASRMTRVWLPGRARCSTACRSANERACRSGCTARTSADAGEMQHERRSRRSRRTAPGRRASDPACQAATPTSAAATRHGDAPLQPVEPRRRRGMSCRSSSDGLTWRTSSSGTSENSSDTSRPIGEALHDGAERQAVVDLQQRGEVADEQRQQQRARRRRARRRGRCRPGRAAAPAPCRSPAPAARCCRRTSGWRCCAPSAGRRRASRSTRRCRRGSGPPDRRGSGSSRRASGSRHLVLVLPVRPRTRTKSLTNASDRSRASSVLASRRPGLAAAWHLQQQLIRGAAAERQQPGGRQIGVVDEHARAEAERAEAAARLVRRSRRESRNGCVPISRSSPTRRSSCASSSGRTSTPWSCSSACEYAARRAASACRRAETPACTARSSTIRAVVGRSPAAPSSAISTASDDCRRGRAALLALDRSTAPSRANGRLLRDHDVGGDQRARFARQRRRARSESPSAARRSTPTPTAMQTKKNSSRCHDARISRSAMRRTNVIARRALRSRGVVRPGGRRAAPAARRPAPRARRRASPAPAWRRAARRTLSSRSMMWRPVVESRLPVGSSASTIGGSLASARAIATRCCSPPESCDG